MTVTAIVFGAVGTAGQRCTSTRRAIVHESIFDKVVDSLTQAYESLHIGTPLNANNHMGPLIDTAAVEDYRNALTQVEAQGGKIIYGGLVLKGPAYASGCYVQPTLCVVENDYPIVQNETFAPADQHHQLRPKPAPIPGHYFRHITGFIVHTTSFPIRRFIFFGIQWRRKRVYLFPCYRFFRLLSFCISFLPRSLHPLPG